MNYGGTAITYDEIGNPETIGGKSLTWNGRELISWSENDTTVSYGYNADGIRTYKVIQEEESIERHEYILSGSQIIKETVSVNGMEQYTLVYLYDELGAPIGIKYRTPSYAENVYTCYFFEKNLQGDIVAIYNASGTKIGTYTYDAWGNGVATMLNASSVDRLILLSYNPFKYRGYYYDSDSGWYYLQSRYYNPSWGRFLNADDIVFLATNFGVYAMNLFIYCSNNPIMGTDPTGKGWFKDKWNDFKDYLSEVFGAGVTVSNTVDYEKIATPPLSPVRFVKGVSETIIEESYGDSSKPISVYANGEMSNAVISSSAGFKINIGNLTLKNSFAFDNLGSSVSWNNGTTSYELSLYVDLTQLSTEGKYSVTKGTTSSYTKLGISASLIAVIAFVLHTGQLPNINTVPQTTRG